MPCYWLGWAVLIGYIALTVAAVRFVPPDRNWPGFLASVLGLAAFSVVIEELLEEYGRSTLPGVA